MRDSRTDDTEPGATSVARRQPVSWNLERARAWIAVPGPGDDKYSRGVLGVITGSAQYPGAAVLGVEAAIRTGVGMVRYLGDHAVTSQVLARRPETVPGDGRVQAWLMGSGMDSETRGDEATSRLRKALAASLPAVLDAGALDLVRQATGPTVILPHAGELARLLTALSGQHSEAATDSGQGTTEQVTAEQVTAEQVTAEQATAEEVTAKQVSADPVAWAHRGVIATGAVVLLKGTRTVVAFRSAGGAGTIILPPATPWLATAGTGDVLGGIIGALVATHADRLGTDSAALAEIAATGSLIHAEAAARASGGGPIAALDIAGEIAGRIAAVLA